MEIQFTIKLSGSSGGTNRAVQTHQSGDKVLHAKSLDVEEKKQQQPASGTAKGGQGGDLTDSGGGGGLGAGQVIVIGPIVISGAGSSDNGKGGGGQDPTDSGGAPAKKE